MLDCVLNSGLIAANYERSRLYLVRADSLAEKTGVENRHFQMKQVFSKETVQKAQGAFCRKVCSGGLGRSPQGSDV